MNTTDTTALHNTKLQVIDAFIEDIQRTLSAVAATEEVLNEGANGELDNLAESLTDKREEMMDDMLLHTQIALDANEHLAALVALQHNDTHTTVGIGALVVTNVYNLLVCTSLKPLMINGDRYIGISAEAPLAHALWGKTVGDSVEMNGQTITIQAIA